MTSLVWFATAAALSVTVPTWHIAGVQNITSWKKELNLSISSKHTASVHLCRLFLGEALALHTPLESPVLPRYFNRDDSATVVPRMSTEVALSASTPSTSRIPLEMAVQHDDPL